MLISRILSFLGACLFLNTALCASEPNDFFLRHIIKKAPLVFAGKELASKVVHDAQIHGKTDCLASIAGQPKEEEICEQLVRSIYNKNVLIKEISIPEALLDETGLLTEESAQLLLVAAAEQNKIKRSQLPDFSTFNFDKTIMQKVGRILQLFVITSDNPDDCSFVLKSLYSRSWDKSESARLIKASSYEPFQPLIHPNKVENMPQFIFPFAFLAYRFHGERHEVGLMHRAAGQTLTSVMRRLVDKPISTSVRNLVSQSYFDVGVAMASFYEAFKAPGSTAREGLKSIIHKDLHVGNVFYDYENRQVILIDNERVADTLGKATDICQDLGYLLIQSVDMVKWVKTTPNFPFMDWFDLSITGFIQGFLSIYPNDEIQDIYNQLEHGLMTYKDTFTGKAWWEDEAIHGYLEPVFEGLREWVKAR